MSNASCRLCLNDVQLINLFDIRLKNAEQLRKCILLATGVEINHDDNVSKYVCQYCSDIAIFLYKYRQKALANDKALKEYANQKPIAPILRPQDIAKFNNHILDTIKDDKTRIRPPEEIKVQSVLKESNNNQHDKRSDTCKKSSCVSNLAVHPTVIQLIKTCPRLKIPNDLLKQDIQPKVLISPKEIDKWRLERDQKKAAIKRELSDMERFRMKCPGISIVKITEPIENEQSPSTSTSKIKEPIYTHNNQTIRTMKIIQPIKNKQISDSSSTIPLEPIRKNHALETNITKEAEREAIIAKLTEPIKNKHSSGVNTTKVMESFKTKRGADSSIMKITESVRTKRISDSNSTKITEPIKNNLESGIIKIAESIKNKDCVGIDTTKKAEPLKLKKNELANTNEGSQDILHSSKMAKVEKAETLNNNVLKKRKLTDSNSDVLKKKLKGADGSSRDAKRSSTKKRNHSKSQTTSPAVDEQLPKIKIILRKSSAEGANQQSNSKEIATKNNSLNDCDFQGFAGPRTADSKAESQESDSEKITPVKLVNNNLFDSDSDNGDNDCMDFIDVGTEDLLDTVDEETALHCSVCNKIFNGHFQLRAHERSHKVCPVCKMIFRSVEALNYHEGDVCFKNIIANPPNLQLIKVDEDPKMVRLYPDAFREFKKTGNAKEEVLCISDDDDDIMLVDSFTSEGPKTSGEYQHIRRIFKKYVNSKLSYTKPKFTETKFTINVKVRPKNQIILENMYPELKTYRVPVQLKANTICSASIDTTLKLPPPRDIYCWANEPVTKLRERRPLLSMLLNQNQSSTHNKYQRILPKPPVTQNSDIETSLTHYTIQNLKQVPVTSSSSHRQIKANTQTPMKVAINAAAPKPELPTTLPQLPPPVPQITPPISQYPPPIPQPTPAISQGPSLIPFLPSPILPLPSPIPPLPSTIPTTTAPNNSTSNMPLVSDNIALNSEIIPIDAAPSTSTTPKESFTLRVKTPWELNAQ